VIEISVLTDEVHHVGDTPELFIQADEDVTGYETCVWKIEKPSGVQIQVDGTVTVEATGISKIRALTTDFDGAGIYRIHAYFTFPGSFGFHTVLWEHEVYPLYT